MRSSRWLALASATAGIWLGLANDVISLPLLFFLWPLGLIYAGSRVGGSRQAFREGWLISLPGAILALYWLALPVKQVGGLPWPGAIGCAILIAAILASQGGFYELLAWYCRDGSRLVRGILLGLGWYLLEYLYALLGGFPWLSAGGALAQWPLLLQPAALVGVWFLAGIWIAALFFIFQSKTTLRAIGGAICLLLLVYGYMKLQDDEPQGENFTCLMVQGNIDQNQKWLPAFQQSTLDLYIALTAGKLADFATTPLIIWPETALPFFYQKSPWLAEQVRAAVKKFHAPLLFGAPGVERTDGDAEESIYNRAFLLDPDGETIGKYDKVHLVPFGEYVPEWLKLDFLEALLQGVGVYREGSSAAPLHYMSLAPGVLICYEGIFPWLAQARVERGANFLADISNDGWFGHTPASRQHFFLTIPRCVEQGRWLMRATNTGITAVIDERGRVRMAGGMFVAAAYPCEGKILTYITFYHRIAPWLPWLSLGIFLITLGYYIRHMQRIG